MFDVKCEFYIKITNKVLDFDVIHKKFEKIVAKTHCLMVKFT